MSSFFKAIGNLFSGGSNNDWQQQVAEQQLQLQQQQLNLARKAQNQTNQTLQQQTASTDQQLAVVANPGRGERLLQSTKDGGLATTLGSSA